MNKIAPMAVVLWILIPGALAARTVGILPDVFKATAAVVDEAQLYVVEDTTVHIYRLDDLSPIGTFGKAGEGPGEFQFFANVRPLPDRLLINSLGKISYYTKAGEFIREIKTSAGLGSVLFLPLGDGYVGRGIVTEDDVLHLTVNFYDAELNKGRELYRMVSPSQRGGKIRLLQRSFVYQTHGDRLYVGGQEGFVIDVLDAQGKSLFTIREDYEPRTFSAGDEAQMREVLKLQYRDRYEAAKDRIEFPDRFPEIMNFFIADDHIYVATWKREGPKIEFFLFDMNGRKIRRVMIPFVFQNVLQPFPSAIQDGRLYQVVENEDEEWELHVTPVAGAAG